MSSSFKHPKPLTAYDRFCAGMRTVPEFFGTNRYFACRNNTVYCQYPDQNGRLYKANWEEYMDLGNFELRHPEANDLKTDFVSNEE